MPWPPAPRCEMSNADVALMPMTLMTTSNRIKPSSQVVSAVHYLSLLLIGVPDRRMVMGTLPSQLMPHVMLPSRYLVTSPYRSPCSVSLLATK